MPSEQIHLVMQGVSWSRWLTIDVDSDAFTPADAFQITGSTPAKDDRKAFREGSSCDLYFGEDRQLAGVVDDVEQSAGRIEVSGRDKGAFLTDNETEHVKASHYTLKTLAEKLLKPSWGVKQVIESNDQNRKLLLGKKDAKKPKRAGARLSRRGGLGGAREKTHIDPGQPVWSALDTQARKLGLTMWITADGSLFIGKPEYDQEPKFSFRAYEPGSSMARYNNVPTDGWKVARSIADRYSDLTVVGQTLGGPKGGALGQAGGAKASKFKATTQDPDLVARGIERKTIIADNDILHTSEARARADFEMGRRRVRGLVLTLTVPGFRQDDKLFTVDTLAKVQIEEADIDGVFWIGARRFHIERGKDRTELTLYQKGVFLP